MFRCPTPREGTETPRRLRLPRFPRRSDTSLPVRGRKHTFLCIAIVVYASSDILLPARGRKREHIAMLSEAYRLCSDILLPVRGRKPVEDSVNLGLDLVQIPFSPWGDENLYGWCSSSGISSFRHLTPREGTETDTNSFYRKLFHVQKPYSP